MSKWLSIELSLLLLVSLVALGGFASWQNTSNEVTGEAFGFSERSAPRSPTCYQYGGTCAQSSSSGRYSFLFNKKPATCPAGYYNFGSTYDCNVCCKKEQILFSDYKHPNGLFEIKYPKNWKAESLYGDAVAFFGPLMQADFRLLSVDFSVFKQSIEKDLTLKILSKKETVISNLPSTIYLFSKKVSGINSHDFFINRVLIAYGTSTFEFYLSRYSTSPLSNDFNSIFNTMISSLKIKSVPKVLRYNSVYFQCLGHDTNILKNSTSCKTESEWVAILKDFCISKSSSLNGYFIGSLC